MAFFSGFKDRVTSAAQSVAGKTREGVEISRLNAESRGAANRLATVYEQIGRLYVDNEGRPDEQLEELCGRALELRERLEQLERQRLQLRSQSRCPACGGIAPMDARFCPACGRRMPEPEPDAEAAPPVEGLRYCPECGAMMDEGEKYCAVCGGSSEGKDVQVQPPRQYVRVTVDDADEAPEDFEAD